MTNLFNFNPLHSFISPVTGRILSERGYVPYGDLEGIATPSPIIIDIRLDLMKLQQEIDSLPPPSTPFPDTLDFILGSPSSLVPNAQVLSNLADGYVVNNAGVLSTTNTMTLPDLEQGKIWLGDDQNKAIAVDTINEVNLPELGVTVVPEPTGGFVGKVWMGTSSGRPEASSLVGEMFADIAILNGKFETGAFIMRSGLRASYLNAQFLNSLGGGIAKVQPTGDISIAIPDEDYATVETLERIKTETEEFKDQAATSAEEAASSAEEAAVSAGEASTSAGEALSAAGEATGAAAEATGAASEASAASAAATASAGLAAVEAIAAGVSSSSASSSASDAEDSADDAASAQHSAEGARNDAQRYLNQLLATGITLTGDVAGSGGLSNAINLTFAANPIFTGNEYMRIPFGTTLQRPIDPLIGMTRINTDY